MESVAVRVGERLSGDTRTEQSTLNRGVLHATQRGLLQAALLRHQEPILPAYVIPRREKLIPRQPRLRLDRSDLRRLMLLCVETRGIANVHLERRKYGNHAEPHTQHRLGLF